ncbi:MULTISPECIES: helix-turn-helix domain-containing protein [Actinomadura]|uniref:Helix-turn-helix domain-containing protein n=1 Tax=Actinomadura miaoliensis TaxID=430685 RepID=A0ABP7UXT3_9ACTN
MADHPLDTGHPLLVAVAPLLDRIRARVVAPSELTASDVPLVWEGHIIAGVRLPAPGEGRDAVGDLGLLLADLERELGGPLRDLPRAEKQRAVRLLEERGAFSYRRSAETVADALGVTRFTVYNYLNRNRS